MPSADSNGAQQLYAASQSSTSRSDNNMARKLQNTASLTMEILQKITDNFSEKRIIGQGTYGKVYLGETVLHGCDERVDLKEEADGSMRLGQSMKGGTVIHGCDERVDLKKEADGSMRLAQSMKGGTVLHGCDERVELKEEADGSMRLGQSMKGGTVIHGCDERVDLKKEADASMRLAQSMKGGTVLHGCAERVDLKEEADGSMRLGKSMKGGTVIHGCDERVDLKKEADGSMRLAQSMKGGTVLHGCDERVDLKEEADGSMMRLGQSMKISEKTAHKTLISHPAHPEHKLHLVVTGEMFKCNGCMQCGGGQSYRCEQCDYDVHTCCVPPETTLKHHRFNGCDLDFLLKPPGPGRLCNACGNEPLGFLYFNRAHDIYLHPSCAFCPQHINVEGHLFDLHTEKCAALICGRCKVKGRRNSYWSYHSRDRGDDGEHVYVHVGCLMDVYIDGDRSSTEYQSVPMELPKDSWYKSIWKLTKDVAKLI